MPSRYRRITFRPNSGFMAAFQCSSQCTALVHQISHTMTIQLDWEKDRTPWKRKITNNALQTRGNLFLESMDA